MIRYKYSKVLRTRRSSYLDSRPVTLPDKPQRVTMQDIDLLRENWKRAEEKQKAALAVYLSSDGNMPLYDRYLQAEGECTEAWEELVRAYDNLFMEAVRIEALCEADPCEHGHTFGITYRVDDKQYHACTGCGYEEELPQSWRAEIVNAEIQHEQRGGSFGLDGHKGVR